MKFSKFKVRDKILFFILPVIIIALVVMVVLGYSFAKQIYTNEYTNQREQIEAYVTNAINFIDAGFRMLEVSIEKDMESNIKEFKSAFEAAGGDPNNISLEDLKVKMGDQFDLIIINSEMTIIKSTAPEAMNFNFTAFDEELGNEMQRIRMANEVRHERIRTNVGTGYLSKFTYIPTEDHQYLLEIAYTEGGLSSIVSDLEPLKIASQLTEITPMISSIRIFDVYGYEFIDGSENYVPTEESLEIVNRVKEDLKYEVIDGNKIRSYFYIDLEDKKRTMTDNSKIVEIIYDNTIMLKELNNSTYLLFSIGFIVVVFVILLICYLSKKITDPITSLSLAAQEIAKGDFDISVISSSEDEIGELSDVFNGMVKKIKENFLKIEMQNEELEDYNRNLEKKVEERTRELQYLSYRDRLTGLYNRRFLDEEMQRLDCERSYPLSLIMLDINGLKLINDAFGHISGDIVLQKVADTMKKVCRSNDIIARVGGDEFIILLPNTDYIEVEMMMKRFNNQIALENIGVINISVSYGWALKTQDNIDISDIFKLAEDHMYRRKLLDSRNMHQKTIEIILNTLHRRSKREKDHSENVRDLSGLIARALKLSDDDTKDIRMAGLMHDIGKIAIDSNVLAMSDELTQSERAELERHPELGYQILRSLNEYSRIAEYVLAHHERWDGNGFPRNLSGKAIPLGSRIIAIAETYDKLTSKQTYKEGINRGTAIKIIEEKAGKQFDPEIVDVFINKVLTEI